MPTPQVLEWLERGPKVPFYVMYGATEAGARLAYLDPARLPDKLGSIGRAIPNVEIVVLTESDTVAAPGEMGEVRGARCQHRARILEQPRGNARSSVPAAIVPATWATRTKTASCFWSSQARHAQGRRAPRRGQGNRGRPPRVSGDSRGRRRRGAARAAWQSVPFAFVSFRDGHAVDLDSVRAFCRSRLPAHKVPAEFTVRAELPKLGAIGKIDKSRLREEARTSAFGAMS